MSRGVTTEEIKRRIKLKTPEVVVFFNFFAVAPFVLPETLLLLILGMSKTILRITAKYSCGLADSSIVTVSDVTINYR